MKKIILVYGLIAGAIMGAMFFITVPLWNNGTLNFDNGMVVGYTTQVIALSLVFFGVKSYRDQHLNGVISFGKAFKVGILITLVGGILYCVSWEICYSTVFTDFDEKMTAHYAENMRKDGATDLEIKDMESNMALYNNPILRFGMTFMEVVPVGLIITLLSAALLRKKEVLPA